MKLLLALLLFALARVNASTLSCAEGKYLLDTYCITCPKGFYCTNSEIFRCNSELYGLYQDSTEQSFCLNCPAGYSCTDSSKTACTEGSVSPLGSSVCELCPAGTKPDSENSACELCPAGSYCPGSGDYSVACENEHYSLSGFQNCLPVTPGHALTSSSSSTFTDVPANSYSLAGEASITCPSGTFSYSSSSSCLDIPEGHILSSPSGVETCPNNQKPSSDSSCEACTTTYCIEGREHTCPDNQYYDLSTSSCVYASDMHYLDASGNVQECSTLDASTPFSFAGQVGEESCIPWAEGIDSTTGNPCQVGYYCTGGVSAICPSGTTSSEGQSECAPCPAGMECTDPTNPTSCTDGSQYSLEGDGDCTNIGSSQFFISTSELPVECPLGTYFSGSDCSTCPEGSYCTSPDTSPVVCASGKYSSYNWTECLPCPAGFSCENKKASNLILCSEQILASDSSPGFYYSVSGSLTCLELEDGYQWNGPYLEPTKCPTGSYSSKDTTDGDCIVCPAGTECPVLGSTKPTDCQENEVSYGGDDTCVACPEPFVCPTGDPKVAIVCGPGYYSDSGSNACVICPIGSYCPGDGTISTCAANSIAPTTGLSYCFEAPPGYQISTDLSSFEACSYGTFNPSVGGTCTSCAAGKQCLTSMGPEIDCPAGYYSSEGDMVCTICPVGSFCSQGATEPTQCLDPTATYSNVGWSSCENCPAGYSCAADELPSECPDGEYSISGSGTCVSCPAGYSCGNANTDGDPSPQACAEGTYSDDGMLSCENCLAGASCVSGIISFCTAGTYYDSVGETCESCPVGQFCPGYNIDPIDCPEGTTAANEGQSSCDICPAGFQCADPTIDPVACVLPQYQPNEGQTTCLDCPDGHFCSDVTTAILIPQGYYIENDVLTICPVGYYCPGLTSLKFECEDGYYASSTGSAFCLQCPSMSSCLDKTSNPVVCAANQYSTYGETECHPCEAGHICSALHPTCPDGFYAAAGDTTCTICDQNSFCVSPAAISIPCVGDTYSLPGSKECSDIPLHYYIPADQDVPIPCPIDSMFNDDHDCSLCPAGYECPNTPSSDASILCNAGTFSLEGWDTCVACPEGLICSSTSSFSPTRCAPGQIPNPTQTACQDCQAGYYCPDGINEIECPDGFFTTSEGNSECSYCQPGYEYVDTTTACSICAAGKYSLGFGATTCLDCPSGAICPSTGTFQPTYCPAGTYSNSDNTACISCSAGEYCPTTSISSPSLCSAGTYSENEAVECLLCPVGYECPDPSLSPSPCSTVEGSAEYSELGAAACTICPAGEYCPTTKTHLPCPAGTYSYTGQTSCSSCPAGRFCVERTSVSSASPATSDIGEECPTGHYCTLESANPIPCVAGKYLPTTGATSSSDCIFCTAGNYCLEGSSDVTQCPAGFICPEGTSFPYELSCDTYDSTSGYINQLKGQSTTGSCLDCPAGYFCPFGTSDYLRFDCPMGYYCPAGTRYWFSNPCPGGYYSSNLRLESQSECYGVDDANECPAGHYCPPGSSYPVPCSSGTYNPDVGSTASSACLPCTAGYSCPNPGLIQPLYPCDPGHYCPANSVTGTVHSDDYPCSPGSYTDSNSLTKQSECTQCTAGKACTGGTTTDTMEWCHPGYYCLAGSTSAQQTACAAGTYNPFFGARKASDCLACPAGYYCHQASVDPTGVCPTGHYCPKNTKTSTQYPCPEGTYNPKTGSSDVRDCLPCPLGQYCGEGFPIPNNCPTAYYNDKYNAISDAPTGDASDITCERCPAGFYCTEGQIDPEPCEPGYYSTRGSSSCTICLAGHYCWDQDTGNGVSYTQMMSQECEASFLCLEGTNHKPFEPDDLCPVGNYCERATTAAEPCSEGYYRPLTGAASSLDCLICPAGYYCEGGDSEVSGVCEEGYYCLQGSTNSQSLPCPAGTYNPVKQGESLDWCLTCPPGYYCEEAVPTPFSCQKGYYCPAGTIDPFPCPSGTYSNQELLSNVTECLDCPPGSYCADLALTEPSGLCEPGYYCSGGAYSSRPDGDTGGICPAGGYCELGTIYPRPCPPGTFSTSEGQRTTSDCGACTRGYYCAGDGLAKPTGPCYAGFYCEVGSSIPTQNSVSAGYYSGEGAYEQIECDPGYYNSLGEQETCLDCPESYYCSGYAVTSPEPCTEGFYCPANTDIPKPCPVGTYSDETMLYLEAQCKTCPPGKYCDQLGQDSYIGPCQAGYYCVSGATTKTPTDIDTEGGEECPKGHYCEEGSSTYTPCPTGTYNRYLGGESHNACISCTAGFACTEIALDEPNEKCAAGYYCIGGAIVENPTSADEGGYICPKGSECPEGSPDHSLCVPGTYASTEGQESCETCPAGYYCDEGAIDPMNCPVGYYCPSGSSSSTYKPCPIGTWSPAENLYEIDQCLLCPGGYYCATTAIGSIVDSMKCPDGIECIQGCGNSDCSNGKDFEGGICPIGRYCPRGTSIAISCEAGTYRATTGGISQNDCDPCPGGYYCEEGSSKTTGDCSSGYYCLEGAFVPNPTDGTTGDICPAGSFCVQRSSTFKECLVGTYQNEEGESSCLECPEGYFCNTGTSNYENMPCPAGYYCEAGTQDYESSPCPAGTYSNSTGLKSLDECIECPPGYYCSGVDSTQPTGVCDKGYYCGGGDSSATPSSSDSSGECEEGYYCPAGSTEPLLCPPGQYCSGSSADPIDCENGVYCPQESETPFKITCPAGSFCPSPCPTPIKCPSGTYQPYEEKSNLGDCLDCEEGYACPNIGQTFYSQKCYAGYYCPTGQATNKPADYICTPGYYCPEGSSEKQICPEGSYSNEYGVSECTQCPEGYYCDEGTVTPLECLVGYYCPEGSSSSTYNKCPPGTYNPLKGKGSLIDACFDCPAGYYCDEEGASSYTKLCHEGYYCPSGSNSGENPLNICPEGHYCLEGTVTPIPCPPGTYLNETGGISIDSCKACPGGQYCNDFGLTDPVSDCEEGWYCSGGAIHSMPATEDGLYSKGAICPVGYYCPEGSDEAIACAAGTYSNSVGLSECLPCPEGFYCNAEGGTINPLPCEPGYYCQEGTSDYTLTPCPMGTYSSLYGLRTENDCTSCSATMYCATDGLTEPTEYCQAGYICVSGASSPTPISDAFGNGPCPKGYYCPEKSAYGIPCKPGTYNDKEQQTLVDSCEACPPRYYCPDFGMKDYNTSLLCEEGYYCSGGAKKSTPYGDSSTGDICPAGNCCPSGSYEPMPCSSGEYAPLLGQSVCSLCPEGYYCDQTEMTVAIPCKKGHYCPEGTKDPQTENYACPTGTFSNVTGLVKQSECTPCLPGYACTITGLSAPDTKCSPGYNCVSGASSQTPSTDSHGNGPCPSGYYCLEATYQPIPCPAGTFRATMGAASVGECTSCSASKYCETDGLLEETGDCSEGYYCLGGAVTSRPIDGITGDICPAGSYCPEGSATFTSCSPGEYSKEGSAECSYCPEGYSCTGDGTVTPTICSAGYYCPSGNISVNPIPCPIGTYNPIEGATSLDNCLSCPPEYACPSTGISTTYTACAEGYFCTGGSSSITPNNLPDNGICPAGSYCPEGTESPIACPVGRWSDQEGLGSEDDCYSCPAGYYCSQSGLTEVTTKCNAGYYCPADENITSPTPDNFICSEGYYCPEGSGGQIECSAGTYAAGVGHSECLTCPAGFYCPQNSASPSSCPIYNYCPSGSSTPTVCPDGYYNTESEITDLEGCLPCPIGSYCLNGQIEGPCNDGYVCSSTSTTPTPTELPEGYICPVGYYCPSGTDYPLSCPENTWTPTTGCYSETQCGDCNAGYVCQNNTMEECPVGYYCPKGSDPQACGIGFYNPYFGQDAADDCLICPAGYICDEESLGTVANKQCPRGHYCPEGSIEATPCPEGMYRMYLGGKSVGDCEPCEKGYYCLEASEEQIECEDGYYCPAGSFEQIICPLGTVYKRTTAVHDSMDTTCFACPAGQYCASESRTETADCSGGYICTGSATTPTPTNDSEGGYVCPAGHYCPPAALEPIACPAGRYRISTGASSYTDCNVCSSNSYNPNLGSTSCQPCGSTSTSNEGATTCLCIGSNRAFQMSDGTCKCFPGYEFYNENYELSDEDSTIDCQEHVYSKCESGIRDANGDCVIVEEGNTSTVCATACESGSGKFISGICECDGVQDLDSVCDSTCRSERSKISGVYGSSTSFQFSTLDGSEFTLDLSDNEHYYGRISCAYGVNCSISAVSTTSSGFRGLYQFNSDFVTDSLDELSASSLSSRKDFSARLETRSSETVGIDQPIMCIEQNQGLVWFVSQDHYPVYIKDSLFNTNPDFDYGAFLILGDLLEDEDIRMFGFTFSSAGVYAFGDSSNEYRTMLVIVMASGESCGTMETISPTTATTLSTLGVSVETSVALEPNWKLIVAISVSLFVFVLLFIFIFFLVNKYSWKKIERITKIEFYKDVRYEFEDYIKMAKIIIHKEGKDQEQPDSFGNALGEKDDVLISSIVKNKPVSNSLALDFWDFLADATLENLSPELIDAKLRDQMKHSRMRFDLQNEELEQFYDAFAEQTNQIRDIISKHTEKITQQQKDIKKTITEKERASKEAAKKRMIEAEKYLDFIKKQKAFILTEIEERSGDYNHFLMHSMMALSKKQALAENLQYAATTASSVPTDMLTNVKKEMDNFSSFLLSYLQRETMRRTGGSKNTLVAVGKLYSSKKKIDRNSLLTEKPDKFGLKRPVVIHGITRKDRKVPLVHPAPGTFIKSNKTRISVTSTNFRNFVIEPNTGRVVLTMSSVFFERKTQKLFHLVEIIADEAVFFSWETFLPFVPSLSLTTSESKSEIQKRFDFSSEALMTDPRTGLMVPIVAATINHITGAYYPLGGTCTDPFSGAVVPLIFGAPIIKGGATVFEELATENTTFTEKRVVMPASGIHVMEDFSIMPISISVKDAEGTNSFGAFGVPARDQITGFISPLEGVRYDRQDGSIPLHGGFHGGLSSVEIRTGFNINDQLEQSKNELSAIAMEISNANSTYEKIMSSKTTGTDKEAQAITEHVEKLVDVRARLKYYSDGNGALEKLFDRFKRASKASLQYWFFNLNIVQSLETFFEIVALTGASPSSTTGISFPEKVQADIFTGSVTGVSGEEPPVVLKTELDWVYQVALASEGEYKEIEKGIDTLISSFISAHSAISSKLEEFARNLSGRASTISVDDYTSFLEALASELGDLKKMHLRIEEIPVPRNGEFEKAISGRDLSPLFLSSVSHFCELFANEFDAHRMLRDVARDVIEQLSQNVEQILSLGSNIFDNFRDNEQVLKRETKKKLPLSPPLPREKIQELMATHSTLIQAHIPVESALSSIRLISGIARLVLAQDPEDSRLNAPYLDRRDKDVLFDLVSYLLKIAASPEDLNADDIREQLKLLTEKEDPGDGGDPAKRTETKALHDNLDKEIEQRARNATVEQEQMHKNQLLSVSTDMLQQSLKQYHQNVNDFRETEFLILGENGHQLIKRGTEIRDNLTHMQETLKKHESYREDFYKKGGKEKEELEIELDARNRLEVDELENEMAKVIAREMSKLKAKHDEERTRVNPAHLEQLSAIQEGQRRRLKKALEDEYEKQTALLRNRQEARRQKRLASLDAKHLGERKHNLGKDNKLIVGTEELKGDHELISKHVEELKKSHERRIQQLHDLEVDLTNKLKRNSNPDAQWDYIQQTKEAAAKLVHAAEVERARQERRLADRLEERRRRAKIENAKKVQAEMKELSARIDAAEREMAEGDLDEIQAADQMSLINDFATLRAKTIEENHQKLMSFMSHTDKAPQAAAFLDDYAKNLDRLENEIENQKVIQNEALEERLRNRRKRKQESLERAANARQAKMNAMFSGGIAKDSEELGDEKEKAAIAKTVSEIVSRIRNEKEKRLDAAQPTVTQRQTRRARQLEKQIERAKHDIERRIEREREMIDADLRKEEERFAKSLEDRNSSVRQKALDKQAQRAREELKHAQSKEQREMLIKKHAEAQNKLQEILHEEEEEQKRQIQERLRRRREQRLALRRQQIEQENDKKVKQLENQMDEENLQNVQQEEQRVIRETVEEHGEELADQVIIVTFQERHAKELKALLARQTTQARELEVRVRSSVEDEFEPRFEELFARQKEEMEALFIDAQDMDALDGLREEMKQKHHAEIRALEREVQLRTDAEMEGARMLLQKRHQSEKSDLYTRQLEQIMNSLRETVPELEKSSKQVAMQKRAELELRKKELQLEREERIRAVKEQEEQRVRALQKDLQEKYQREKEELERQQKLQAEQMERKMELIKQQALDRKKREEAEEMQRISRLNETAEKRKELMENFQRRSKMANDLVDKELDQQRHFLLQRLKERQRARAKMLRRNLHTDYSKNIDGNSEAALEAKKKIEEEVQKSIHKLRRTYDSARMNVMTRARSTQRWSRRPVSEDGEFEEEEIVLSEESDFLRAESSLHDDFASSDAEEYVEDEFTTQPFRKSFNDVEHLVNQLVDNTSEFLRDERVDYVSEFDRRFRNEGELELFDPKGFTEEEHDLFDMGCRLIDKLIPDRDAKIALLPATRLPETEYESAGNVFCHSYFYDVDNAKLYVRRERFQPGNDIITVICHAVAHVQSRSWSDGSPGFRKHIYLLLSSVRDLFAAST